MNLGEASIVLRHRPALEVVDLTLRFVRNLAPKQFVVLTLFVLVPCWLAFAYILTDELPGFVVWVLALMAARVLELPFTILCGRLLFERAPPAREIAKESFRSLPRFLLGLFFYSVILIASLVLIVGPLFVGGNYFFLSEVLVLEKASALRAFKRSHQFLAGRSGTGVEGLFLRLGLMGSFIVLTETLGQAVLVHLFDIQVEMKSLWDDGVSAFSLLGLFLSVPYAAAHRFLAYTNERTRQDGWDIQVAFLQLAAHPDPTSKERDAEESDAA